MLAGAFTADGALAVLSCPRLLEEGYPCSLEWVDAKENLTLIRPAGTGKSHLPDRPRHAAVDRGLKVRYFTAAELVEDLYRGLADNSVGRLIKTVLRDDLIICDEVGVRTT